MARTFFTTMPDGNLTRNLRRGGRNEIKFALAFSTFMYFTYFRGIMVNNPYPKPQLQEWRVSPTLNGRQLS